MIGAMPSGVTPPVARASITFKRCALGKMAFSMPTNRGNENNFGMHVNKVQLGGPGEEEHSPIFANTARATESALGRLALPSTTTDHVYVSDDWKNTISVFDSSGKFSRKWGTTGSGDGELFRPAGLAVEKNGNIIVVDSGNNRLQVFTPDGKFVGKCGGAGNGDGQFNQPWGITLDKDGNIYVADWKNHRVQKLSPEGKFLMKFGQYRQGRGARGLLCRDHVRAVCRRRQSETAGYPRTGSSIIRPTSLWTPMATSTSPIGAITGFASSIPREGRSAI